MSAAPMGLILGYGSIGRRHARALAPLVTGMVIVNRREPVRAQAAHDFPRARVIDLLEGLDHEDFPWTNTVAVIATWGPSHSDLFHALADRGVRRILCEKPMAASVAQAQEMVDRAEQEGIALGLNHTLRYAGLAPALRRLAAEHELGEPVGLVMAGGAAGLLTNGIHWLDFAVELFDIPPHRVISTAAGESINPRSPELKFYGGTAIWSFADHREAIITLSNRSSLFPQAHIYYRHVTIRVGYEAGDRDEFIRVVARRRDRAAVAHYPALTRTGPAGELLFDGRLPGVRTFNEGLVAAVHELVAGDMATCPGPVGVISVSACLGALLAGREQRTIALPLDPTGPYGRERWPIS